MVMVWGTPLLPKNPEVGDGLSKGGTKLAKSLLSRGELLYDIKLCERRGLGGFTLFRGKLFVKEERRETRDWGGVLRGTRDCGVAEDATAAAAVK
jgi:hypothetical protein